MFVAVFNMHMILVIQYHKYAESMVGFEVEHNIMHDFVYVMLLLFAILRTKMWLWRWCAEAFENLVIIINGVEALQIIGQWKSEKLNLIYIFDIYTVEKIKLNSTHS